MKKLIVLTMLVLLLVSCHSEDKIVEKTTENELIETTTEFVKESSEKPVYELSDCDIIKFNDEAFENYIRKYYDLPAGDIRFEDVKYREKLEIGARFDSDTYRIVEELPVKENIHSLEDLKYFRNLKSLCIYKNSISTHIDDIATLYQLKELYISRVAISGDIKALSQLKNLKTLILGYTEIKGNINELARLDKLEYISLNSNSALGGDIKGLNSLKNLKHFYVASGKKLFGKLSEFERLEKLEVLTISNCDNLTGDISKIVELPNLKELDLNGKERDFDDKEMLEILEKEGCRIKDCDIIYSSYQDYDNNGDKELIIGVGEKYDSDEKDFRYLAYFGIYKDEYYLEDVIDTGDVVYNVNDVKIVERKDNKNKLLVLNLTNFASLKGVALFEIKDSKFYELGSFASATGAGNDYISYSEDGYCAGVISERHSYDVYYYPTRRFYAFRENGLELVWVSIIMGEYPDTPKKVVQEYISLNRIAKNEGIYIDELEERLGELSKNPSRENIWDGGLIYYTLLTISPRIDFDVTINGDKATVKTSIAGELDKDMIVDKLVDYELEKIDNKWVISKEKTRDYR